MTAPHYGDKETVEVRVRISPQAMAILRRMTETADFKETIATRSGRILTAALLEMDKASRQKKADAQAETIKADPEKRTVAELAKTHSLSQISAILRLPYAAVAKELGRGVDDIVRKRDQREVRP